MEKAFHAISRPSLLFEHVGIRKINLLRARLRHSPADPPLLRQTVDRITEPLIARKSLAPIPFEAWRTVANRFSPHKDGGEIGRPRAPHALSTEGFSARPSLAPLTKEQQGISRPPPAGAANTLAMASD